MHTARATEPPPMPAADPSAWPESDAQAGPEAEPEAMLRRALASWRIQRAQAFQHPASRHSVAWLHAAFEGLELALAGADFTLARALSGEALALALACLYGGPAGAKARLTLAGQALEMACEPCPAHRWRDALLLACITAQPAQLSALGRALPAEVETAGDAWALAAGRTWLGWLAGSGDVAARIDLLRNTARSDAERAWAVVQDALLKSQRPGAAELARLPALATLALQAVLAGRGQALADAPLTLLPALQGAPVPALDLHAGQRIALHAREPAWWFELHGPGGSREHRLRDEAGRLVAQHLQTDAGAGIRLAADFVLQDTAAAAVGRLALDAGELLALADRRARTAAATLPADAAAQRRQRSALADAVELVDAATARLPAGRAASAADVPSALGRATFEAEPARFDRERLQAVRNAYAAIANAAPAAAPSQSQARAAALAAMSVLRAQLEPLLWAIARDGTGQMAAELRPHDDDYERVFTSDSVAMARAGYARLFAQPHLPKPADAGQTRLLSHLAPAGMLADDNELSRPFPGGYRAIANRLNPHRVWVRWKFCRPGETAGMAYDGLVWVDDHWAWFPKPYRVLGDAAGAAGGA